MLPAPRGWLAFALASALACVGCGSEDTAPGGVAATTGSGGAGGGPGGCPPGEATLPDGSCVPAGVPDGECGDGFESDGLGGCVAILPARPCGRGTMAVPGERACRPVWPCGAAQWGDVAIEASTQFVDASYAGMDSDGSEAKPWTTIQAGIDAAADGAVVAVAAGDYTEDLSVAAAPVRIRGRCPEMVRVTGTGMELATVLIGVNADQSEVGGLSIEGPGIGVIVSGSDGVLLEGLWVHDVTGRGIDVENVFGPTSVIVRSSLVEGARDAGIIALSVTLDVEASVVRDMDAGANGLGRGIVGRREASSNTRSTLSVRNSLIERARDYGIYVQASDLTLESTLLRDIQTNAGDGLDGIGWSVEIDTNDQTRGTGDVRTTVVERAHTLGAFVAGSDATIDRLVVRSSLPDEALLDGSGMLVQNGEAPATRGNVQVSRSLFDANRASGISMLASDLVVESSIVRGTQAQQADGLYGRGFNVVHDPATLERANLTVRDSVIENNVEHGIGAGASDVLVEHSVIRDTVSDVAEGHFGRGIDIQSDPTTRLPASLTVRGSLLERNRDVAIMVAGCPAVVEDTTIRDTMPRAADQKRGRAIGVQPHVDGALASLVLRGGLIEQSREAAITTYQADVTIEGTVIRDTGPQVSDGLFGDGIIVLLGKATLTGVRVEGSHRVGIAAFSSAVGLASSTLECNAIDLDRETILGPVSFDDLGGNVCGCDGANEACQVTSSNLAAPDPPD